MYERYQCSRVAIEEVPMNQTDKYGIIVGNLVMVQMIPIEIQIIDAFLKQAKQGKG